MFARESLYINAIKYKSQLKINYKKLSNNNIVDTNSSTFVVKEEILGRDIATKINAQQEQIDNSYISTLLIQDDAFLVKKNQAKSKDTVTVSLNDEYDISVSKNTLFETKNFFEKCGVDYIFSAYHILNLHLEQNTCNNNLVALLFDNQAFCFILNSKGEIVFHKRVDLTSFEDIKKSEFFENEILGQKLYDEVYALELFEVIKKTIEDFYATSKNIFVEKVALLYNLKLVSEEQIQNMSNDLMMEVSYHPISVDEELFQLSKDKHTHKSFIKPRSKSRKSVFKSFLVASVLIAAILGVGYQFLPFNTLFDVKIESKKEMVPEEIVKQPITVVLPNHIDKNSDVETKVLRVFEMVPYDIVLNEVNFEEDSVDLNVNLINKDTYIKTVQPELLKIYKSANIEFKEQNKKSAILEAIISAKTLIEKDEETTKNYKDVYVENEFMPIIRVTEQIKILFPENAIVTFKSSTSNEVVTFNYVVNVIIQSPIEFFKIIDRLNNELYSVNISYPLTFVKTAAGIEAEFILQFHQPK